jgi:hypothetical protein
MLARIAAATATFATLTALAGPASAIDADRRLGDDDRPDLPRLGLLAPITPELRCHLVSVVPVEWAQAEERTLLYRPCDPPVLLPPYEPFEDRPPILIPVLPRR